MSTPTTIRIRSFGDVCGIVTTCYSRVNNNLDAHFHVYFVNQETGQTSLEHSEVWSTEKAAIDLFDKWVAAVEETI